MITPLDIQNKEFGKSVRGYKKDEVDMFLDLITLDLEKITKENVRLKAEMATLESKMEKYKGSEGEVVKVLEQARELMGDISKSAEKRAEMLFKNAELDAELIVREAKEQAQKLMDENLNLKSRYTGFRDTYKNMLKDELKNFEHMDQDIFQEFNDNKLEELMQEIPSVADKSEGIDDKTIVQSNKNVENNDNINDRKTMVIDLKNGGGE